MMLSSRPMQHRSRPTKHPTRLCLPLCLLALASTPARAEDDEWALSVGPAFRGISEAVGDGDTQLRAAPGALVRVRYGIGDFFQLGASLDAGVALPTGHNSALAPIAAALFEVHYVLDIVTWVPFVSAGIGALMRGGVPPEGVMKDLDDGELRVDLAVTVGGGLEYRPAREWAIGFAGRYELVVSDFDRADAFSLSLFYTSFFE